MKTGETQGCAFESKLVRLVEPIAVLLPRTATHTQRVARCTHRGKAHTELQRVRTYGSLRISKDFWELCNVFVSV